MNPCFLLFTWTPFRSESRREKESACLLAHSSRYVHSDRPIAKWTQIQRVLTYSFWGLPAAFANSMTLSWIIHSFENSSMCWMLVFVVLWLWLIGFSTSESVGETSLLALSCPNVSFRAKLGWKGTPRITWCYFISRCLCSRVRLLLKDAGRKLEKPGSTVKMLASKHWILHWLPSWSFESVQCVKIGTSSESLYLHLECECVLLYVFIIRLYGIW